VNQRRNSVDPSHSLSIRHQCELLDVARSTVYYKGVGESDENLRLMAAMDRLFTGDPTLVVLGMQDELAEIGMRYNSKRFRRLLRKMGVEPIYPKRNLSRLGHAKYVHPYLLRELKITRPNQVWAIDITYIPMKRGFMYLSAIIDLYSRFIVGWQLSNSLEKENQTTLLREAIKRYGSLEMMNSDQGPQYTCAHWVETLREYTIRISMDGKGRATNNAFIERWFRTIKQKYIYLNPPQTGLSLFHGIRSLCRYIQQP